MFSAHHKSKPEDQPAADHAFLNTPCAEGRLGKTNFIHFPSQPSRSTKLFKRGGVVYSRTYHTATVIGTDVFMIGGQNSLNNSATFLQTTLLVMDSSTLVVNEQNSTKVSVAGHGAVPIGGSKALILFGKKSEAPLVLADPVQQIDVQTGVLSTLNIKGTAPAARYAHTVALVDNKVYVIGGMNTTKNVIGDVSYIDLSSNSWNIINIPRQAIAGHSTTVVGKYLITCFGFDNKFEPQNNCNVFDTINNVYVKSEISGNPPTPRIYSSMVTKDNDDKVLYIFGGLNKSLRGYNDLYTLDATNLPNLNWSPVSISAKSNPNLIPSPRGAHSAVIQSNIMVVWGGHSGTTLSDAGTYLFDIKANAWVDAKTTSTDFTSNNLMSSNSRWEIITGAIIAGVIIIAGIIVFFVIRRRRLKRILDDNEIQNDPYIRPGGQLGSNPDLPTKNEDKKIQKKDMSTLEPVISESMPPPTSSTQLQSKNEKESKQSNDNGSTVSTDLKFSSDTPLPTNQTKHVSTESQRTKRTHKRTSSVSLTPVDLANITRPRSFVYHKSSLSTSSISNSTNRSSLLSSTFDSIPSRNSGSTFIASLESPTSEKSNRCDSRLTSRSVKSMQWVGFNSKMIEEREKERFSLHVRNISNRKSTDSEDEGYVIRGDYINTATDLTDGRSYNGDFMDYEDIISAYDSQKRRSTHRNLPGRNCISAIPERDDIVENGRNQGIVSNDGTSSGHDTQESGIADKYTHQAYPSQNSDDSSETPVYNEEDEGSSRKSKRSSKRISRVSFALRDEKIEFDETESSKSVSFARASGRTSIQSSESSGETPSIIEEEEEEEKGNDGFPNSATPKVSAVTRETLRLYENGDEFNSTGSRISRFSLSIFNIGKDQSTSHDAVSEAPAPPVERTESPEVRHSIKELMIDQGVLWAIQDVE